MEIEKRRLYKFLRYSSMTKILASAALIAVFIVGLMILGLHFSIQ